MAGEDHSATEIRYGKWTIAYDPPPIPVRTFDWSFWHDDYDGAEDARDGRCGHGASVEDCKAQIDEMELDTGTCPKCGLQAKTLLHRFCQHRDCPVRAYLEKAKATGEQP